MEVQYVFVLVIQWKFGVVGYGPLVNHVPLVSYNETLTRPYVLNH